MESEDDMMTQRSNLKKIASLFFTCVIRRDWLKWKKDITKRMYENKG